MKKFNTSITKKIAVISLTAAAALSFVGCNSTSTSTYTETITDSEGNTTTTTTTTTNGETTTETTETSADDVVKTVATISFDNQTNFDFKEFYFVSRNTEGWGENAVADDPLEVGRVLTFDKGFTYTSDDTVWDLMAVDADGNNIEITGIDMSEAEDPENIYISIEYDDADQTYSAYFINN